MTAPGRDEIPEDLVCRSIEALGEAEQKILFRTIWKDGIDIEVPTYFATRFAELIAAPYIERIGVLTRENRELREQADRLKESHRLAQSGWQITLHNLIECQAETCKLMEAIEIMASHLPKSEFFCESGGGVDISAYIAEADRRIKARAALAKKETV